MVTTAGKLPFKGVIHAVGPRLGDEDEGAKIVRALTAAFLRAQERGWASVSFPGLGSGIFAVPPEICARAYLRAVRQFFADHPDSTVTWLRLVLFHGPVLEAVNKEIEVS